MAQGSSFSKRPLDVRDFEGHAAVLAGHCTWLDSFHEGLRRSEPMSGDEVDRNCGVVAVIKRFDDDVDRITSSFWCEFKFIAADLTHSSHL
ncbi:hypothetical protein P8452_06146 [Trifolium repens]|nr:hypothetical protein P8452_06146 [Trifolium repens]